MESIRSRRKRRVLRLASRRIHYTVRPTRAWNRESACGSFEEKEKSRRKHNVLSRRRRIDVPPPAHASPAVRRRRSVDAANGYGPEPCLAVYVHRVSGRLGTRNRWRTGRRGNGRHGERGHNTLWVRSARVCTVNQSLFAVTCPAHTWCAVKFRPDGFEWFEDFPSVRRRV